MVGSRSNLSLLARIIAWNLAIAIVVLSLVPPGLRPETPVPHDFEHAIIYWATGFAFGLGYERNHGLLAILLLIFTGLIEIAQLLVPGRHARVSDFIVDAFAVCAGLIVTTYISRVRAPI